VWCVVLLFLIRGLVSGSCQVGSREGSDTAYTPVPLALESTETMRLSPETSSVCEALYEGFSYCRTCGVTFEEYDEIHGRVCRFCSFCGHKLLNDVDHRVQSPEVASKSRAYDPDYHVVNKPSSSATALGDSIHRRSRSRSPHPRVREIRVDRSFSPYSCLQDRVERSRAPLPSRRGAKRQRSPTPDVMSTSQREQLEKLKHRRAPSLPKHEKKKLKIVVVEKTEQKVKKDRNMNGKHKKEDHDNDIMVKLAGENSSRLGESSTRRSPHEPAETIGGAQNTSPIEMDPPNLRRPYNPAREPTHSTTESHARIAKIREELSSAPNVRTAPEQRQLKYRIMNQRWRKEELNKQAKKLQKEMEKEFAVAGNASTEQEQRQAEHRRNNLLYREDNLNKQKRILQKRIEQEKGKEREMVDLTVDDE